MSDTSYFLIKLSVNAVLGVRRTCQLLARPTVYVLTYRNHVMLFPVLQTPALYLSSPSDGLHLEAVKLKETDRDYLLGTFVGGRLTCD